MSVYGQTTEDAFGYEELFPAVAGSSGFAYPGEFNYALPGYVIHGWQNTTSDERSPDYYPQESYAWGSSGVLTTDPSIGSLPGMVDRLPYQYGPVCSDFMEVFELTGEYISIRRKAEASSGPVGFSDYSSILASALAQANAVPASVDKLNVDLMYSV